MNTVTLSVSVEFQFHTQQSLYVPQGHPLRVVLCKPCHIVNHYLTNLLNYEVEIKDKSYQWMMKV